MRQYVNDNARLIVIALLALALLVLMLWATGGGFSAAPAPTPTPAAVTATAATAVVQGAVSVRTRHLHGHTWQFSYLIRDTGTVPIAGFQLNGPTAYLFHLYQPHGWNVFGSGVCGHAVKGVLAYWSVNAASPDAIAPGRSTTFRFEANTSGASHDGYSLSWGSASPQFGQIPGPAASSLPRSVPCR